MTNFKQQLAAKIYIKLLPERRVFENREDALEGNMFMKREIKNTAYDAICKAEAFVEMFAAMEAHMARQHKPADMIGLWEQRK